ncbi:MAG TPA: hypothetical protein VHA12_03045 [Candidatus Nanoarchaeia archaeon]|nr:hypothetical protein [Candidatus Nanoarchaeia archaeon]
MVDSPLRGVILEPICSLDPVSKLPRHASLSEIAGEVNHSHVCFDSRGVDCPYHCIVNNIKICVYPNPAADLSIKSVHM